MRIFLGGHLNFYHPQKDSWLELEINQPRALAEVLAEAGIPEGEVYLAVINRELVELSEATVSNQDDVKLFPAVGGG